MEMQLPQSFHFVSKSAPEGTLTDPALVVADALEIAAALRQRGVRAGDRVALWLLSGADQIAAMLGCWMAQAAFCMLPSFAARSNSDRARDRISDVISVLDPVLLVQAQGALLPETVTAALATLVLASERTPVPVDNPVSFLPRDRAADDLAFVQFTSGSTGGKPKGAEVRRAQLEANLDALAARINMTSQDRMMSWAPLYHDMGLMAVLLSLRHGADLVLMETDHFVRRPTAWLETMSRYKATLTTAPPTALKLLVRRQAKHIDLSALRYAWIGGEAVFPIVLQGFEDCYAAQGLRQGVLQPTYGMAETVVGISCGKTGSRWHAQQDIISCGPPLDGMQVRIANDADETLADGQHGHVLVRGPSVISGYFGLPRFDKTGWFDTGDLGFLWNGELFVSGRTKDVLKRGAESFTAALVEAIAEEALDLRTGRAAAFVNFLKEQGKEEIVLLVEARAWDQDQSKRVAAAVMKELGLQIDTIRATDGGRLPRTSSGKIMRQQTAKLYREGHI
ncbi:MAG: AMP-binding protein [Pseudomonadota bacterium]